MEFLILIDNTLNQTLIYSFLALSVYISLRLLDYPDLSIEGTFPMGAAISASIATYTGFLSLSIPIAIIFGFLIGILTASLHVYLKIGKLLSGILVAIGLYSINFRIMGAKANLYLLKDDNIMTPLREYDRVISNYFFGESAPILLYPISNILLFLLLCFIIYILYLFFQTELGALIRYSRSDTKFFFEATGVNYKIYVILGIGIASALASFAGALVAFQSGSASTSMGFGIILIALVSLVIGEEIIKFFHKDLTDLYPTILTPVIGTFIYFIIIKLVRWGNTLWQSYSGYPDPTSQLQFFNSDIKVLSVIIMISIYIARRQNQSSLTLPERL